MPSRCARAQRRETAFSKGKCNSGADSGRKGDKGTGRRGDKATGGPRDGETEGQGDKATGGQGDRETRRPGNGLMYTHCRRSRAMV